LYYTKLHEQEMKPTRGICVQNKTSWKILFKTSQSGS